MNKAIEQVRYDEIIFDEGIYPRIAGHDPSVVQTYARDLQQIEERQNFISVNAANVLLDGRHRMLAYKKNADGQTGFELKVWKYPVESPLESFRLACELQDKGKALSNDDRVASAKKLYSFGMRQKDIAAALSTGAPTVSKWLSRTIKEGKAKQRDKAFELWLSCHTQEEIAEAVGIPRQTITDYAESFLKQVSAESTFTESGYTPPIYNVWTKQTKTNKVGHFGNTESQWLDNLLYLYTNPFDVVVDPFAGGGSTIDVCKHRGRRYLVSDRKPIVEREHEIKIHDVVTDGLPKPPMWKDVKLVYLDPPYWKQAEGEYSNDPSDLANMELEHFTKNLSSIVCQFSKKLSNAFIALIIQPTQWKADNREFTDHVGDMLRAVNLPVHMRYSVPYESQQCTAQMVEWAKENKTCLVLTREIIVWEVE
jgi:hypothetical protein